MAPRKGEGGDQVGTGSLWGRFLFKVGRRVRGERGKGGLLSPGGCNECAGVAMADVSDLVGMDAQCQFLHHTLLRVFA